ncbi:MAG: hemerythrin family protein [Oscillospiraceae bacterium]|jgi:hemerythrin|nr:hemerythrin family protein [Oscillospiraceae bacterium]
MIKAVSDETTNDATRPALFTHNMFIIWQPEFNLGIPIIDEQHRGIVSTINSFYYGMQSNYIEDMLLPVIDMVYDYTYLHFRIEENLLEQVGFPDVKSHHKIHQGLSSKLNLIGRKSVLDKDPYRLLDFLKDWWIHHICSDDMVFRNYLLCPEE